MRLPSWLAFFCLGICCSANGAETVPQWRELSDDAGTRVQARFEGVKDGRYKLRRKNDDRVFEVAPGFLNDRDRSFFDQLVQKFTTELPVLNKAAGYAIFTGAPFDANPALELADIMKLPTESNTKYSKSWRKYVSGKKDYTLFGAHPYSVALYGDETGKATHMSVVYANKGDFGSNKGSAESHFEGGVTSTLKTLNAAMDADSAAITKALTEAIGAPSTQRFGEGNTRRVIKRWDWSGTSILLSHEDGEYVGIQVVPTEFADAGGKSARMNDTALRDQLRGSVVRGPNGDVYVADIPMVDQGPKGYCVPATFERAMRKMGISADMYLLAMVGESGMGGGTSVGKLMDAVRRQVYSKGRRTKDESFKELKIRDIKRFIDDGVPIMWTMLAMDDYGKIARENTDERQHVDPEDMADWIARVAKQNDEFAKRPHADDGKRAHMCMIIGYNEKTQELAVSDSWGQSHALKWVPLKVAQWVSGNNYFLILP